MRAAKKPHSARVFAMGLSVFSLFSFLWPICLAATSLAVWTDDEQQHVHDLVIVEQIDFNASELLVVTVYCTHKYPLESVVRIDFLDFPADADDIADIAKVIHLFQNYPNPFNPETKIRFELPEKGWTKLCIYAVNGQLVRTLVEKNMTAGMHSVRWNGLDDAGRSVASGVYFYSLAAFGVKESRKMILLR